MAAMGRASEPSTYCTLALLSVDVILSMPMPQRAWAVQVMLNEGQ